MKDRMQGFIILMVIVLTLMIIFIQREREAKEMAKSSNSQVIKLPAPRKRGDISLEEAISKRRSKREFRASPLSKEQISQLLWAAQGITDQVNSLRAAPSAGALYPLEIYIVYSEGVYHYRPQEHILERISAEDVRLALCEAAMGQEPVAKAPLDVIITAVYERTTEKYEDRGIRYVHMEAGHCAQNILLEAVTLGLGSVSIGAFSDEGVSKALSLPAECKPLYIIPVGVPQ
jgi:SagB-type dehydrogenase family enzyme